MVFNKIEFDKKVRLSEKNRRRYRQQKIINNKKPKKDEIIENSFTLVEDFKWLRILKLLNNKQMVELAEKTGLTIEILRSLRLELYKPTKTIEKNLNYCLKEMGLYENTKS
jgi:hypothetical protein